MILKFSDGTIDGQKPMIQEIETCQLEEINLNRQCITLFLLHIILSPYSLVNIFANRDIGIAILSTCSLVNIFTERDIGIAIMIMGTTTFEIVKLCSLAQYLSICIFLYFLWVASMSSINKDQIINKCVVCML